MRKFGCARAGLGGLKGRMSGVRPNLRVLTAPVRAAGCAAPSCRLPANGEFGLCEACERVYRCLGVLCDRLLARDVARLEHESPGITAAVRATITATLDGSLARHALIDP